MASGTPSLDGSGSNGILTRSYTLTSSSSSRDYDSLKQQCDKAMSDLTILKRQHSETARRCDHAMKELDYYRGQHRAAMNQLEASVNEKQRLEREVQVLRSEVNELHCHQEVLVSENGNADSLYVSLSRRNEAVRDDYEALRKRYDDLLTSHSTAIAKLELAQEETSRLNKQCDELSQERNNAVRERNGLKQQCTAAIRQWDMALRERNEYRDALAKVQQQHEEAVKEVNQAMAVRMKASKDIKRLTDERNAAMQEYTLIMSERDTVHKEMEKLSDDLTQEYKKTKILEGENKELIEEKKALNYQMETLRREIASALHDRDKALKECNDLREKFGEYNAAKEDSRDLIKSRLDCVTCPGESSARKEVSGSGDSRSLAQRQRLDNLDQANQELEALRKTLDKVQSELTEAMQEAEVSKRRRDWAFSERDKIVLERESIRTLCDKLRKERDRAVSDLAEALRDSDDLKKQRNEACKELKTLKEVLEAQLEKEASVHQFQPIGHNHSHDSAIDTDMQEFETEILDMDLSGLASDGDLGFELVGGRDNPHYPNDSGVYVAAITKGSIADGKLRVNDCISRVNNIDCTAVPKRVVLDSVRASLPRAHLVVRRRRIHSRCLYTTQLPGGNHGLSLETGMYICKISPGSTAAKEGNLAVGDRVLSINNKTMDGLKNCHEAMSILNDDRTDITITVLKSMSNSQTCNQQDNENINYIHHTNHHHHQKKVNSCSQTEDMKHYNDDFVDRQFYKMSTKNSSTNPEKNNGKTWNVLREKISIVRSRRHSKERSRTEEKSKYRNSSPNALTLSNSFDQEQAIAELDSVIDNYHGTGSGNTSTVLKRSKRRSKDGTVQEKNGGTWPKARSNVLQNPTGTIVNSRKRERAPLSLLLNGDNHDTHCCNNNRNSTPIPISLAPNLNRHTVYRSMDNSAQVHFPSQTFSAVNESFDKLREHDVNNRLRANMTSNNSLDYSVKNNQIDKDLLDYYSKKTNKNVSNKYGSDLESNIGTNDITLSSVPPTHVRLHSQLYGPQPRLSNYLVHPHSHPHSSPSPLQLPSSQSRESFCFEPPYATGFHSHNPSVDAAYKKPQLGVHSHIAYRDSDLISMTYTPGYEGGTFPRKKENQRFRIPSNPSVTSKNSAGKVSNGSIERTSDHGSPMPTFHVEVLSPGNPNKRNSLPDYCWPQKPSPGELRRVHIDKSAEPLGIQISCPDSGGIFVSTVNEHSLASQVGLQIGDQLLEVCGINMRSATYQLAANVLRQCGNSITMLVQYSPDKYHELEGSGSCSSSQEEDGDGEPTPCNSPRGIRKSQPQSLSLAIPEFDTGQNTLTRSQIAQVTATLHRQNSIVRASADESQKNTLHEPRYLLIETQKRSNLGISLVGGNAVGIYVHSVQPESLADNASMRTGDQILEYNGADLRHATAEEAAYELAKPADKVTVLAHYKLDRYNEIKDKPGDSLYVRCGFDRSGSELTDSLQLCFNKDDVLYVDNTMFNGVPGHWRAWRLDGEGHRHQCGIIPSKYKVEEELLLRRSLGDLEGRGSTSARRSFFRRKKYQRNGSRDSKELASFSNVAHTGWYSDSGTLHEDVSLCSYQRVERLDYTEYRPVLVLGPLAECVVDKLVTDFPDQFRRCTTETRHCPQSAMDQELADNLIIDYKRKGSYFECTTVASIKAVCDKNLHCIIDITVTSVEKLHRHQIYPIVLLIKFKSTKQIKEVKDTRYPLDKVTAKAAKEMYEHGLKLEAEYKHRISTVIPAGVNIAYMCTQVKAAVETEQNKSLWVPCQNA
ncbi:Discs large 5 [Carabus blaptoides fortunei]